MNNIFKKAKKKPLKVKGYTCVGIHPDYEDTCYFVKHVGNDNYEFMEAKYIKEGHHNELAAGTTIKVLDSFMYNRLRAEVEEVEFTKENKDFIAYVYNNSFNNGTTSFDEFLESYNVKIPSDITKMEVFKQYKKDGYEVLYCHKAISQNKFETYDLVLVNREEFDMFGVKRVFTRFKPIVYMTKPSYIKKTGVERFKEFPHSDLYVIHDILNK